MSISRALALLALSGCSETNLSSLADPASPPADPDAPIADAGPDQTVEAGDVAALDGSKSRDPNGLEPLVFQWSLASWPNGSSATIAGIDTARATLATDVPGDYVLDLTVQNTDGLWDETPDEVTVSVPDLAEPVADAGPDQEVAPLDVVQLDGTASYDPDGLDIVAFQWTLASQPAGSTSKLSDPTAARPTLFADLAGDYVLDLAVQNSDGTWDSTPDTVAITAVPLDNFYVQLSWDSSSDLDLHLLDTGGRIFDSPTDCNYCDVNPAWGVAGGADNPSLDIDAIYGFGPETITIDAPSAGTYTVDVHYYGKDGLNTCANCPLSNATVSIYIDAALAASYENTLTDDGDLWTVATIDWPSGQITEVNDLGSTSKVICY